MLGLSLPWVRESQFLSKSLLNLSGIMDENVPTGAWVCGRFVSNWNGLVLWNANWVNWCIHKEIDTIVDTQKSTWIIKGKQEKAQNKGDENAKPDFLRALSGEWFPHFGLFEQIFWVNPRVCPIDSLKSRKRWLKLCGKTEKPCL